MQTVPRIVVADDVADLAGIVRGALALLSRPHILIEVPTSDDALQELATAPVDLVVASYRVPGQMNGVELADCIVRESLRTPVIVLAEERDPAVDVPVLPGAQFQYFVRPVGEHFVRGLRAALDGDVAVDEGEPLAVADADLGPVPGINVEAMRGIITSLLRDVGALGVIVADRTGRVLIDQGMTGDIDCERLAALLGPGFARAAAMGELIGGNTWTMHYYDGERMDVFGLGLGVHYFACLLFDGAHRGAFGAVRMFGRRAADQLIGMMGAAAYRVPSTTVEVSRTDETARHLAASAPGEAPGNASESDLETLLSQPIDEGEAALLFDPDVLTELAASLPMDGGDQLDYDDAIGMGLLDE